MKSLMVMWILSLVMAVGTGWLAFSTTSSMPIVHALFLLSVGAFVVCSIWTLARGLSPLREHQNSTQSQRRAPQGSADGRENREPE